MNDKIILKKENNVIKEIDVVDSNGKVWKYQPDFINFAELEHEDVIETLECKKEQLTKVVNYNEKQLAEAKKVKKITNFIYPGFYIFFFAMFTLATTGGLKAPVEELLHNIACTLIAGGMTQAFSAIFINLYTADCKSRYTCTKSNLDEITKDLEEEKAKEIEKNKNEIEFKLKNNKLEELDRKYTRVFGNCYTRLEDDYTYVVNYEDEKVKDKPKTLGSKKK